MNAALEKKSVLDYKLDDENYFDDGEPEPLFDEYGNPTPETLQAFYEIEHGLTKKTTLDEFLAELDDENNILELARIGSHSEILGL